MWIMSTIIRKVNSMAMRNPPHPGGIVRRQCLEPLELSVTDAAKALGVTRQALSDLVNESAGVSVEMAIRLSKAFGSTAETWLGMQMAYDLWQARSRAREIRVRSLRRLSA
jgi:addiction module HigA family antidote